MKEVNSITRNERVIMRCVFKGTLTTPQEKAHSAKTNASTFGVLGPYAIYNLVGKTILIGLRLGLKKGGRILYPIKMKMSRTKVRCD